MQVSETVLIESKSARDAQLVSVDSDRAMQILNKAKAIIFALSKKGVAMVTTEQMAEFYETSEEVVRKASLRHKDEFESDGLRVLSGKSFSDVRDLLSLSPKAHTTTIWTPRSAVRLGMIMRDSGVAKRVRTNLLNIAEAFVDNHTEVHQPPHQHSPSPLELARQTAFAVREIYDSVSHINPALAEALINLALKQINGDALLPSGIHKPQMLSCTSFAQRMGYQIPAGIKAELGKHVATEWRNAYNTQPTTILQEYSDQPEPLPVKTYPWGDPVVKVAVKQFFEGLEDFPL
jgi:hypothetical protein